MIAASGLEFSESMETQKATVYFTCQHEVKALLQAWADERGRSLSSLVERIALAALEDKNKASKGVK